MASIYMYALKDMAILKPDHLYELWETKTFENREQISKTFIIY